MQMTPWSETNTIYHSYLFPTHQFPQGNMRARSYLHMLWGASQEGNVRMRKLWSYVGQLMTCLSSPPEKERATEILSLLQNIRRHESERENISTYIILGYKKISSKKGEKKLKSWTVSIHKNWLHTLAQGTPAAQGWNPWEKSSNTRKAKEKNIRHFWIW